MPRRTLRYQLDVIGAILLLVLVSVICIQGIGAGLGAAYAMPQCERACRAIGIGATDFVIRMGKRQHSTCECSNGMHRPSAAVDAVGAISFFVTALITIRRWIF